MDKVNGRHQFHLKGIFLDEMGPRKAPWVMGKMSQSDCVFKCDCVLFCYFMFFQFAFSTLNVDGIRAGGGEYSW